MVVEFAVDDYRVVIWCEINATRVSVGWLLGVS